MKRIEDKIKEKSIDEQEVSRYLLDSFKDENINLLKSIINNYPKLTSQPLFNNNYYPLGIAILTENVEDRHEIINLLLAKGADIEKDTVSSLSTPLIMAFNHKRIETLGLENPDAHYNSEVIDLNNENSQKTDEVKIISYKIEWFD